MKTIPSLGMGTFRLEGETAYNSVKMALETGYRHIDTAQIYGNEAEVGQAIADSGLARDEFFVTTKVWLENLGADAFIPSVKDSLRKLQVEAVTNAQLDEAIEILGEDAIFTNQVEIHPYLNNSAVINHCQSQGIRVTGFMPLAAGKVMQDEVLQTIAAAHNASVAEVVLAWQLQQGLITIPSSTKRANLETNLKSVALILSDAEMTQIYQLNQEERIANPDFAPEWD